MVSMLYSLDDVLRTRRGQALFFVAMGLLGLFCMGIVLLSRITESEMLYGAAKLIMAIGMTVLVCAVLAVRAMVRGVPSDAVLDDRLEE